MYAPATFYGPPGFFAGTFAPKKVVEEGFASEVDKSIIAIKTKALKVDLLANTTLSKTVKDTTEKYSNLVAANEALKTNVQAEVDSFLGLDFKFIKDTAVPFMSRIGFLKTAAKSILSVADKVTPVVNGIKEVKSVLESVAGDSLVEITPLAKQDHEDVVGALQTVDSKVTSAEENLKNAAVQAKQLNDLLNDPKLTEESFNFGGFLSTAANIGGTLLKTLL